MRYVLPGPGMWATCDMNAAKKAVCRRMYSKFLPLFGLMAANSSTNQDFIFKTKHNHSKLVCASQGAAGLGMLTDHGYKLHGWSREDYESLHNHGRSSMLYEFRNFMVTNIGLDVKKLASVEPYSITIAASTSRTSTRNYDFGPQILAIRDAFGSKVIVQKVDFANKSLHGMSEDRVRTSSRHQTDEHETQTDKHYDTTQHKIRIAHNPNELESTKTLL
ncbi:DUF563-containing protein [Fragilaria crotonensis]|nr:DUF563-containing protein [Fragilaria crotonensis]